MQKFIGREKEILKLDQYMKSSKSEFIVIYGRRRVGKTFLIRYFFKNSFTFQATGLANVSEKQQLIQFHSELMRYNESSIELIPAQNWYSAFDNLRSLIENNISTEKKVIFFDELPWLAKGNKFVSALEHFWNSWASTRDDILLIGCGSAASWMIDKIINNRGGLHNRITGKIKLEPFTLAETELFLKNNDLDLDRYQILILYMVLGGIPFYLEQLQKGYSTMQNINSLCFQKNAVFRTEFQNIFRSLFKNSDNYVLVIESLVKKKKGLTRDEIAYVSGLSNGGGLTKILNELEQSSFIRKYNYIGNKAKNSLYQLIDPYSLFYLNFIKETSAYDENYWINIIDTPKFYAWSGYSFELICLLHVQEIKIALGISGIQTSVASWNCENAQIDLVIDRKDHVISLCEMKFTQSKFSIDRIYEENLKNKLEQFKEKTGTKKSLFLTLVTTYGLSDNKYASLIKNLITMNDLFRV